MGIAKRHWENAMDRGWTDPETSVCLNCISDDFLCKIARKHRDGYTCDYCKERTRGKSTVPLKVLMPYIQQAVSKYFTDPSNAGVPYSARDGGYYIEPMSSLEMIQNLTSAFEFNLSEDIANALTNDSWVATADGDWVSVHPSVEMSYAWGSFVTSVKHQSRYFFMHAGRRNAQSGSDSPLNILAQIADHAKMLKLIKPLAVGSELFRVREKLTGDKWELCEQQLLAPPNELAAAGRMNPAGIAYMYLAFQPGVALGEVLSHPPCQAAVVTFETKRELLLLDLTQLPEAPSIFDVKRYGMDQSLSFLAKFVADTSKPFSKDGGEHISYVPSQVVSEYFNQVFETTDKKKLDGILYPSSIQPGGKNVVLFPPEGNETFRSLLDYRGSILRRFDTWPELTTAISGCEEF